jgi:hypothetical protein
LLHFVDAKPSTLHPNTYNWVVCENRGRKVMVIPRGSMADNKIVGWQFDNTYSRLPDVLFAPAKPAAVPAPRLSILNTTPSPLLKLRRTLQSLLFFPPYWWLGRSLPPPAELRFTFARSLMRLAESCRQAARQPLLTSRTLPIDRLDC